MLAFNILFVSIFYYLKLYKKQYIIICFLVFQCVGMHVAQVLINDDTYFIKIVVKIN